MGLEIPLPPLRRKISETTKCPYCGTVYEHTYNGPLVEIFSIKNQHWAPEIKTRVHDARQPIKCDGCGANFELHVNIPKYE